MKVVAWPNVASDELKARLSDVEGIELEFVDSADRLTAALAGAEVLVTGGATFDHRIGQLVRQHARSLRFVQLLSAGYERVQEAGVPAGVIVASAGDSWSPAVAEHAMAMLLSLVKRLPQAGAAQGRRVWDRGVAQEMGTLQGRVLAIVGFGSIGKEVARRARAFGMRIVALSRDAGPSRLADEVRPAGDLLHALSGADVILLALPSSPQTHKLMDDKAFAACKPGAILINVARGDIVDPDALVAALQSGRLGGAGLDVADVEPLPESSSLWTAPNLLITPHVSGSCGEIGRMRLADFVAANVRRFARGEIPDSLIDDLIRRD